MKSKIPLILSHPGGMYCLLVAMFFVLTASLNSHAAGISPKEIKTLVQQQDDYIRLQRRHFHEYPELSGQEKETAAYLKAELQKLGDFQIHDVPNSTGFYAILETGRAGKTIGLRTDIDGLPIQESPTNGGGKQKKWLSKNAGVTQGCGHDGHMSILLGTARVLHRLKSKLSGRIVFIFEEGEESNSGIRPMIEALKPIHFDFIYGNHVSSLVPSGKIFLKEGPIMAGMATVALHVIGKGGHASRPDLAINPVPAAAEIAVALGTAWNNQRDVTQTVTLGLAQLQAGKMYNVIPDSAFLGGTLRFFNIKEGENAVGVVKRVAEGVAAAHRCRVSYDPVFTVNLPPVSNDSTLTRRAQKAVENVYPGRVVKDEQYIWYASETFALYSQLAPTVFAHVGIRSDAVGSTAAHHTAQFDLDEDALQYGVGAMTAVTINFLEK